MQVTDLNGTDNKTSPWVGTDIPEDNNYMGRGITPSFLNMYMGNTL